VLCILYVLVVHPPLPAFGLCFSLT
jgi:hypothetical protein